MDKILEDIQNIGLEGDSRSARWKSLRKHLKQLIRVADENSDKLASLEAEVARIRESNLQLTEVIQILGNLANEEVQREISLTLNYTDFDIVVDVPAQDDACSAENAKSDAYTVSEFLEMVKGTPGIGAKKLQDISNHLGEMTRTAVQSSLDFGDGEGVAND